MSDNIGKGSVVHTKQLCNSYLVIKHYVRDFKSRTGPEALFIFFAGTQMLNQTFLWRSEQLGHCQE